MKDLFPLLSLAIFASLPLAAGPLTGSGGNLPLPASGSTSPGVVPVIAAAAGSFTGTWSGPAASPWLGTFTGTGDYPQSGASGTSLWNFSGLAAGNLPAGTYVRLGDVDSHTGEVITLTAFLAPNVQVSSAWLDEPVFLSGATPSEFLQANLPSWSFSGGIYTFTGVDINTLLTISLQTNIAIGLLQVDKAHINNGFGLAAPNVPEPGTWAMLAFGLSALAVRARRR